jgi:cobalt-zinc-cadmium efflux system outer membrane protein
MRRSLLLLFGLALGCGHADHVPLLIEEQVVAIAQAQAEAYAPPSLAPVSIPGPLDLPALWSLALIYHPSLRESAAEVEAARGRMVQAGKCPNPQLSVSSDEVFTKFSPHVGNPIVQLHQEIVTGGKLRLDQAVAGRRLDAAALALLGRKFEVLTNVRRAYFDYLALGNTVQVYDAAVTSLERSVELTRQLVERAKTRPRTDLIRLEALLAETRANRERARTNLAAAWRQVATAVGVPELTAPSAAGALPSAVPNWSSERVKQRVLAAHSDIQQAALEAEAARLAYERARVEVIPNITVGAGYIRAFVDETAGAVFSVEAPLPIWDRKQGRIHAARAEWARANAAQGTVALRLTKETTAALARYEGARQQVLRYEEGVLPPLVEALRLVREGYQAGVAGISFADVQLAQEALNDARLKLAGAQRELWQAVADLQGLMQLDVGDDAAMCGAPR